MRKILIVFFCVLAASLSFAQGAFIPPQSAFKVVNGMTAPISDATITVCGPNASGIPCSPALVGDIFADQALTEPLSNPFLSDAYGNYQFAAAAGTYTVTVTSLGFQGNSYQVTLLAGSGTGCGTGTTNFVMEWTGSSTCGNSTIAFTASVPGPNGNYTTGGVSIQSAVPSPTSGALTNMYNHELLSNASAGSETITNNYLVGLLTKTSSSFAGSITNDWELWGKAIGANWAGGIPAHHAVLHCDDQTSSISAQTYASDCINIAPQGQAGGGATNGMYAIRSGGPQNFALFTNHSQSKVLTSGSATQFVQISDEYQNGGFSGVNNWIVGGRIDFCVVVQLNQLSTSPSYQESCGSLPYSIVDVNATTANVLGAVSNTVTLVSTGTLTVAFTATNAGAYVGFNCDATSSLSSPTITLFYDVNIYGNDTWTPIIVPQ